MIAARRCPLVDGVAAAAMLIAPQATPAKTRKVPIRGGYALFSEGGPRPTIQACDTKKDGKGVAAFVLKLQSDRSGFVPLVGAVNRNGRGTCGKVQEVGQAAGTMVVKVCLHDRSKHGRLPGESKRVPVRGPVQGAFDSNLEGCKQREF